MRPDQLIMLGVGLLGGYAVYRLVTAPKDQAPPPATAFDPTLRFANPPGVAR
jgi:hypothetical protein